MSIFYYDGFSRDGSGSNFGDDINPFLMARLLDHRIVENKNLCVMGVGTLLNDENIKNLSRFSKKIVFSTGAGYGGLTLELDSTWDVVCVRGEGTARTLGVDYEKAICDGAVLLSNYFDVVPESCRVRKVTFIPHIKTHRLAGKVLCQVAESLGINYLSPDINQIDFIEQVSQSRRVITEAMHGAILADTMRVPWLPVHFFEHNQFKWEDWFRSVSLDYYTNAINFSIWNPPGSVIKRAIKAPYQGLKAWGVSERMKEWLTTGEFVLSKDSVLYEKKRQLGERVDYINEKYAVS
ncbi:polysaccharide pyruvyl transferase family protein [Marinobacter lacisalsi]|uniref:Polysaccharide pyruvyl transferase family protein n=1 Tax=Marinobacter lacisalsi TaxID=475979 RepID=A0ABV8QDU1_9GAMM